MANDERCYTEEQEWLADMLVEWRDAGGPVLDVVRAVDRLIVARLTRIYDVLADLPGHNLHE